MANFCFYCNELIENISQTDNSTGEIILKCPQCKSTNEDYNEDLHIDMVTSIESEELERVILNIYKLNSDDVYLLNLIMKNINS